MAEKQPIAGGNWHGLNRAVAPHALPPNESPDCMDCAPGSPDWMQPSAGAYGFSFGSGLGMAYGERVQAGILTARRPRIRAVVQNYNLNGGMGLNLPWARGRLFARADGSWGYVESPYAPPADPTPMNGWDRVSITTLGASQAGVGSTNGTAKTLSNTLAMGDYGAILLGDGTGYTGAINITATGVVTDGTIKLQGNIGGSWTDLYSWRYQAGVVDITQNYVSGTGNFTQVRLVATVAAGAGTLAGTLNASLYLQYGIEQAAVTVS